MQSSPFSITHHPHFSFSHLYPLLFIVCPEHPNSPSDLVPLLQCDGPKLKPFDFKGPLNIEFLESAGSGSHSYVFKVKIRGETYALKLVSQTFSERAHILGGPLY